MTTCYYCRASKANRKGLSPIELSLTIDGHRVFINLPRRMNAAEFNRQITSRQSNDVKEYVQSIDKMVDNALTQIAINGECLTLGLLRERIKTGGIREYTVGELYKDFIKIFSINASMVSIDKYKLVYDELLKFIKPDDNVQKLTNALIKAIVEYFYKSYKESTAVGKINRLKAIVKFGVDNRKIDINPFNGIRVHRAKPVAEYLTIGELDIIKNKQMNDRLDRVRDLFLFQCGTGLSYADMNGLKKEDVKCMDGKLYIQKKREKTDIQYTSVLLPCAIEVWNKYNGRLPKISNQRYNGYLDEIAAICGIDKNLHTHLGRKTYATTLLNNGVNIHTVSKSIGHSSVRTTEQAYAFLRTDTIIEEIGRLI